MAQLFEEQKVAEVRVEGVEILFYIRSEDKPCLEKSLDSGCLLPRAAILAPLDNLLWDRRLVKELFEFDYRWEVYKPIVERQYGYYVLPVLYGDRFVARFEPGRDKKNMALIIKNWWWEPGVNQSERMHTDLLCCFKHFLNYLDADILQIDNEVAEQKELSWLELPR